MTKFTFRLLELRLKYLCSNLYFGKMFDTSNCILLLSTKDGWLDLILVATLTAHEQVPPPPPWIRHWTIHKHLHPSTITQDILTTATPTGMFTILPNVSCRREQLRGIVRRPMNSNGTELEQVVHIHPTFVPELVRRAPW